MVHRRTFWTWPWMMPWSHRSLQSKSLGRVGWSDQPPSSLHPPILHLQASAWALSKLTMKTMGAPCGHPTSGAMTLSPTKSSSPSGPTAPWAWPSTTGALCSPHLDRWKTWSHFLKPLLLQWLPLQASLPRLISQLRSHRCCPLTVTKLSCAVASRRLAAVSMAASASSPMVKQNYEGCTATLSTRQSPAEPSTTLATVPMAHAATSSMKRKLLKVH